VFSCPGAAARIVPGRFTSCASQPGIELVGLLTTLNTEFQARGDARHTPRGAGSSGRSGTTAVVGCAFYPGPARTQSTEQLMREACDGPFVNKLMPLLWRSVPSRHSRLSRDAVEADRLEPLFPLWEIPTDFLARENDRRRPARKAGFAWIRSSCRVLLQAATSMPRC